MNHSDDNDLYEGTLAKARTALFDKLDEGSICPCCDQLARRYERKLNSGMAASLIWLCGQHARAQDWVNVPACGPRYVLRTRELPRLTLWGLVEDRANHDPARKDSGFWRPTTRGINFVSGNILVPSHVRVYLDSFTFSDTLVSITHALGDDFDFQELMEGRVTRKEDEA